MNLKKKNKIKQTEKQIMAQKVINCLAVKKIKFAQFENKKKTKKSDVYTCDFALQLIIAF